MGNHKAALTKQVFTFASELYAYGVREVVISPYHAQRHLHLHLKHIQILKHGYTPMSEVQRFCSWVN